MITLVLKEIIGVACMLRRLPGIGPAKAEMAVGLHGPEEAWRLACEDAGALGVRKKDIESAQGKARIMEADFECLDYLLGLGLTVNQAKKIINRFGKEAKKVVSETPYVLIKAIDGFGFLTVDKIALKAGINPANIARMQACIVFVLSDSETNMGHIWMSAPQLRYTVNLLLEGSAAKSALPDPVGLLAGIEGVEINGRRIYSKKLLDSEILIQKIVEKNH